MGSTQQEFQLSGLTPPPRRRRQAGTKQDPIVFVGSRMNVPDTKPTDHAEVTTTGMNRTLKVGEAIETRFMDQMITITLTAFQDVQGTRSLCGYRVATLDNRARQVDGGIHCTTIIGFGQAKEAEARAFARQVAIQFMRAGEAIRWTAVRDGQRYTRDFTASDSWK